MIAASVPHGETARLAVLRSTGLLGTLDEYMLDRVTSIGAHLFGVPICLLSLVDSDRQWLKSSVGTQLRQTPRAVSFCGHVVASGEAMIVEDALRDERFLDNPLVLGSPHIRFYAGHPLRAPTGEVLGTLCAIDLKTRVFLKAQRDLLKDLARLAELCPTTRQVSAAQQALVSNLAVARRESLVDPLLRIWNRGGLDALLERADASAAAGGPPFTVLMMDIDHFKRINDSYGHVVGDAVHKIVVRELRRSLRTNEELGRFGGDEFLAVLSDTSADGAESLAQRLSNSIAALRVETSKTSQGCKVSIGCTVSVGIAQWRARGSGSAYAVVERADVALLAAKRLGRNRVLLESRIESPVETTASALAER